MDRNDDELTRHADEIVSGDLWLGSEAAGAAPADTLAAHGITHILVPADTGCADSRTPRYAGRFHYLLYRVTDMPGFPIIRCWPAFVAAIEEARAAGGAARASRRGSRSTTRKGRPSRSARSTSAATASPAWPCARWRKSCATAPT